MNPLTRTVNIRVMAVRRTDASIIRESMTSPARFADLFDRHFPAIHRYLARRIGRQLADDIAAETFLQAFRARERFDLRHQSARPWLYGIATNVLRYHHREERRRLAAYARIEAELVSPDETEAADSRVHASSLASQVAAALAELSRGDRDALLLFAWGELSYEEIARALRIPVGTVRSRLSRARRRLRELIPQQGQYQGGRREILRKDLRHG